MTQTEQEILAALVELESAVQRMKTETPKPNLMPIFTRIDDLARTLPDNANPQLQHYLRKKSYEKARLFLQGREAENAPGNCHGHVE
ncbi:MAG: hypothetical protein L0Y58_00600 [Verrucomicrobia subdivision 3 bacterium]|nr:hypothetical protein [Limisphaerales bacterium]